MRTLLGGVLIATTSVETAFAVTGLLYAVAALPTARIPRDTVPEYRSAAAQPYSLSASMAGFRDVARDADLRLIVGFLSAATLVEGAVDVLVVVMAIELLDLGSAGVGWLNAAWGLGGLLGGGAALALLGRGGCRRGSRRAACWSASR